MHSNGNATAADATEQAARSVDAMLDEMSVLANSADAPGSFYRGMLDRVLEALEPAGGAVWLTVDGGFRLECEVGLVALGIATDAALRELHERTLATVVSSGKLAKFRHAERTVFGFFPWRCDGQAFAVIEIIEHADGESDDETGAKLLDAVSEIACDFHRSQQLALLRGKQQLWSDMQAFARVVHGSLQIQETAFAIANEGRRFIGCDRVTVASSRGGPSRVLAVSGVARVERRTDQVRQLERLISVVAKLRVPFVYPTNDDDLPPEIERPLQDYLDASHARLLRVLPIEASDGDPAEEYADGSTIGAIVVESFSADEPLGASNRVSLVHEQGSLAFRNALEYSSLPLLSWARGVRQTMHRLRRHRFAQVIAAFGIAAVLALVLTLVPAELTIEAEGHLQPKELRHVFAPADGAIVEVLIQPHESVAAEQPLAMMHSAAIALRHEEIASARDTTLEKLRGIESARLIDRTRSDRRDNDSALLSATEQELQKLMASQNAQLAILQSETDALQLRSPFAGNVLTWNVVELLDGHPVTRGQKLMSVAKLDGDWQLELQVLDKDIGHVLAARQADEQPLLVTFALATDAGRKHQARLRRIANTTQVSQQSRTIVMARADVEHQETVALRPGASVIARIHCGHRSLGFVWLRDLIEFAHRHILF